MTEEKIRQKLKDLAQELYSFYNPELTPMYPWVLVYVLPKEQRVGSIWTAVGDKNQNKVTFEGIVLKTWPIPYGKTRKEHLNPVEVGDHVLFPHFAGQPVSKLSDKDFRLVKELPFMNTDVQDFIIGKVNYTKKEQSESFASRLVNWGVFEDDVDEAVEELQRDYIIHPKASSTLSGK